MCAVLGMKRTSGSSWQWKCVIAAVPRPLRSNPSLPSEQSSQILKTLNRPRPIAPGLIQPPQPGLQGMIYSGRTHLILSTGSSIARRSEVQHWQCQGMDHSRMSSSSSNSRRRYMQVSSSQMIYVRQVGHFVAP